jgi:hypothetical protein
MSALPKGARITLFGFVSEAGMALNGVQGIIKEWHAASLRYHIIIDGLGLKAIKPANVTLASPFAPPPPVSAPPRPVSTPTPVPPTPVPPTQTGNAQRADGTVYAGTDLPPGWSGAWKVNPSGGVWIFTSPRGQNVPGSKQAAWRMHNAQRA